MVERRRLERIDVAATLRSVAILPNDPTVRHAPGRFDRATLTPEGPAALRVSWTAVGDGGSTVDVEAQAWGDGGSFLLARLDGLLGIHDDPSTFAPDHERLARLWRGHRQRRFARTGTLWHDLAALILQQRIRFVEAANQWRRLVERYGEPAPGPLDLQLPPEPSVLASLPYADLHPLGIERSRAENLQRAAREMPRVAHRVDDPFAAVEPRLAAIRGVGPWTTAGVAALTWGDADAVPLRDVGIPSMVTWFFERKSYGTDDDLLRLLEPFRPHRGRVISLLYAAGVGPPARPSPYGRQRIERH